jgi:hypothetical protein
MSRNYGENHIFCILWGKKAQKIGTNAFIIEAISK